MGHHLTDDGRFKSAEYDWCPVGFFALDIESDFLAQACALLYSKRTKDKKLAADLRQAIRPHEGGNTP